MASKLVTANSAAKCIITGEHSVVYGHPAVATAISPGVTVRLYQGTPNPAAPYFPLLKKLLASFQHLTGADTSQLTIAVTCHVPAGSGLGVSAALGHAICKALFEWFDFSHTPADLFQLIQQGEKLAHHQPSGVDAATVIEGGLIHFHRQDGTTRIEHLDISAATPITAALIQSGRPAESTAEMVQLVANRLAAQPRLKAIMSELGEVSRLIKRQLTAGQIDPAAIHLNHHLLVKLGVVDQIAQEMITEIAAHGGAAKISGAGGRTGGSGMIIAFHPDFDQLTTLITQKGWQWWPLTLPHHRHV